jgi:hypothetical protein
MNIKKSEFWFTLYDKEVIAECSAKFIDIGVQIDDVLVEEKHRGKGFCQLLLRSVVTYFRKKSVRVLIRGELNTPQESCYKNVFGDGIVENGDRVFLTP